MSEFDLAKVREITGLSIDDNNVINDSGRVFFLGNSVEECVIYLRGYCQGNIAGIRESMEKFGVEQIAS